MTEHLRSLISLLPPELRNEIYNYISIPDTNSTATNSGLPLQLKKYECKHTTVQICPVHYGSTGLIALQKYHFQEAHEYFSWLLKNALELRIAVTFRGRANTFVQADWDKKLETHLRKLAKQYPWLKKVVKYDIQILWDAIDGPMKSRKNKRTAGQIPRDMGKTLTQSMDENVKRKLGDVKLSLHLGRSIAIGNAISGTKFGLGDFFSVPEKQLNGFKKLTQEVWLAPHSKNPQPVSCLPLVPIPSATPGEKNLLVVEEGMVYWTDWVEGRLVVRKNAGWGNSLETIAGDMRLKDTTGVDYIGVDLVEECLGRR